MLNSVVGMTHNGVGCDLHLDREQMELLCQLLRLTDLETLMDDTVSEIKAMTDSEHVKAEIQGLMDLMEFRRKVLQILS